MKSLTDQLKIQIEKLNTKVTDSLGSLAYWEETVKEQSAELVRLRKALAALEGKPETPFTDLMAPNLSITTRHVGQELLTTGKANIAVVDGVEYEVPDGYEIGKNSFGETAIVPKGVTMAAMAEPTKPAPTTHGVVLPATN